MAVVSLQPKYLQEACQGLFSIAMAGIISLDKDLRRK